MRHAVFGRKLGRDTNARHALLGNLASSILEKGQVNTTLTKAKFVRSHVEKLITHAKRNSIAARRSIAPKLTRPAFRRLINEIGPGFANRPGGYTKITRLTFRRGDAAPMARIELLKIEKKAPASTTKSKPATKSAKIKKS